MLSRVQSTGQQYRVAKLLNRNDIDASEINSRSVDEQRQHDDFISRHGEDGVRVAADGGEELREIVVTGKLDTATTDRLSRAYERELIDEADLQRIGRGLDERVIDQQAVETALGRINNIDGDGHSVDRVRTASEINSEYGPDYQDPYAPGTLAVEYTTESQKQFVRVHGSDNQARAWMMREHEIEGLTADEIKTKFSLPEEPVYVSDVDVPKGTSVRTGTVAENFGGKRGATQFELQDRIDSENFHNRRELPQ